MYMTRWDTLPLSHTLHAAWDSVAAVTACDYSPTAHTAKSVSSHIEMHTSAAPARRPARVSPTAHQPLPLAAAPSPIRLARRRSKPKAAAHSTTAQMDHSTAIQMVRCRPRTSSGEAAH